MKRLVVAGIALAGVWLVGACGTAGGGGGGAGDVCGSGVKSALEQCDKADLGGVTCKMLGLDSGNLVCSPTCTFDPKGCCTHQCPAVGDTQCKADKTQVLTCTELAQGCRDWALSSDCAKDGKTCDTSTGTAQCKGTCVDACLTVGEGQCNTGVVEVCQKGADGCKDWVPTKDCLGLGQKCIASSGTATCGASCVNLCSSVGATTCSGNVLQTCKQDNDGCFLLETTEDCAAKLQTCISSGGSAKCGINCNNGCNVKDVQTCQNDVVTTCTADVNGCLDWQQTEDCKTKQQFCKLAGGGKAKCEGVCTNPCPTLGEKKCSANLIQECKLAVNACQEWQVTTTCPLGQKCDSTGGNFTCVTGAATGEDCGTVIPIKAGKNTVSWTATVNDYLPTSLSCASPYQVSGADVVMAYTAGFTGSLEFSVEKPSSNRWVVVAASGSCGSLASQLACVGDSANTVLSGSINVTTGTTYFFYAAKTTYGSAPLSNPLVITLTEIDCATFTSSAVTLDPPNGGTTTTLVPKPSATFDVALTTSAGTVKLTGDKGTNLTYAVGSSSQLSWTNGNKTLNINPGISFPPGEAVTVDLSGFTDSKCSKAINKPAWGFTIVTPPCSPGTSGMVGATPTKLSTGLSAFSEYYMTSDSSPSGYVYIGNTSELYRVTKSGGGLQYVNSLAGLGTQHLGYGMLTNGSDLFTVESKTTGQSGHIWRISKDSGVTWPNEDFALLDSVPSYNLRAGAAYKGKIYLVTAYYSSSGQTQVWGMSASPATVPTPASVEASITGEAYCDGLAVDDGYFYLACGTGNRLIRVDRTTKAVTLLTSQWTLNTTVSPVYADDTNADGTADYLYFKGSKAEVYYVCNPAGATPYTDMLLSYGTSSQTSDYGLAFDASTPKTLWAFDDATYQLVKIQ